MRPKDIKITKFTNLKATKNFQTITLFEELKHIKQGTYKNQIILCRKALNDGNTELYNKLKQKLPAVTFCGEFLNGRKITDLVSYNNLMIIDIDKLEDQKLKTLKTLLSKDEYVYSVWESPSGNGLKCIFLIDSNVDKHKSIFI